MRGTFITGFAFALFAGTTLAEPWVVVTDEATRSDAAFRQALADLNAAGGPLNITFAAASDDAAPPGNAIAVGAASANRVAEAAGGSAIAAPKSPQAFQIKTIRRGDDRVFLVVGGSTLGNMYGMYWVWDRLRVFKRLPDMDTVRAPRLEVRLAGGDSAEAIRMALRYGATWCTSYNVLDLVPWDAEPEHTENAQNRAAFAERVRLAHDLHLKFIAGCDEITYHPSLWKEFNVSPSPADPALWNALQEKYRRLFRAMPDLDGVLIRTGELTLVHGNYKAYDVMHEPADAAYPLEERYRMLVRKIHEVVVGEFNKIYFHRTWDTNPNEQHANPDLFKAIFTDAVPTRNLYLSPYMTRADRWLYQPFNPTFNLTPHSMAVLFSTMDYHAHAGVNVIPIYPGQYFRDCLQSALSSKTSNLVGTHFAPPASDGWQVQQLTAYTAFRLAWDPDEDPRTIAEDFAAIHFGREAAKDVAEVLLLSHDAYKDGCYIKPVAESVKGNTLRHLRLTTFPMRGIPPIDKGKAHIDWLRSTMYGPCAGRLDEAVRYLDRGLDSARGMESLGAGAVSKIEDTALARQFSDALVLTRALIETNNCYVKTCFAYFAYRDARDDAARQRLAEAVDALESARTRFIAAPGYVYKLYGIDQLLVNARDALAGLDQAERKLANAPSPDRVEELVTDYQKRTAETWARLGDKVQRIAHWSGTVDGQDLLHIRGKDITIQHLEGDPAQVAAREMYAALPPRGDVSVLTKDVASRPWGPFVLEQPSPKNDYTATVFLFDGPPSSGAFEFEIGFAEGSPEELGLVPPWSE